MKRLVLVLLAIAVCGPSYADTRGSSDPDDVRGPLDIKRISHGHASGDVLWHKVVMHRRWGARHLEGDEIRIDISTDGEARYDEVRVSVAVEDGKLAARIYEFTEGSDYGIPGPSQRIRFTRPDRRGIKVFFNESWVNGRSYGWSVSTQYRERDSESCSNGCSDYAPGRNPNRVEHKL